MLTVPYFNSNQNPRTDTPARLVSIDEARKLKKAGKHYFSGNAIVQIPAFVLPAEEQDRDIDDRPRRIRTRWAVIDQTAKPGIRHRQTRIGPGAPRYAFV